MSLVKNRPALNCWPKNIQTLCLFAVFTVVHVFAAVFAVADSLIPTCCSSNPLYQVKKYIMKTMSIVTLRHIKHVFSVLVLISLMFVLYYTGCTSLADSSAVEYYGVLCVVFYAVQSTIVFPLPFVIFNFLGVVLLNVFTSRPKLQRCPLLGPFLCFRIVTRGLFPELVKKNLRHNLKVCEKVGIQSYIFEVVSDIPVSLQADSRCREIVVPGDYKTSTGALYKARALQYALEPTVNILSPGDWIVHLDEETILTEEAAIGIINFAGSGVYSFGQGVIIYGKGKIINWITTLADSVRVGVDYGYLRFSLGVLHRPIFSWKGSFIVADAEAEKTISFDHGPESSIAEDCFFACMAYSKGYSFGFVEGEMIEQSTFTFSDFIQQRRRWIHGILLTAVSKRIPLRYRIGPALMSISSSTMPLTLIMILINIFWPVPKTPLFAMIYSFASGTLIYLFILGTIQTFCVRRYGIFKCSLLVVATIFCAVVSLILETVSSILVFWTPKISLNTFHVVNKQVQNECIKII